MSKRMQRGQREGMVMLQVSAGFKTRRDWSRGGCWEGAAVTFSLVTTEAASVTVPAQLTDM